MAAREFQVLDALSRRGLPVPRPLLLEPKGGPFGAPTLVTTRLPGRPLLQPFDVDGYLRQLATTLAELHRTPIGCLGPLPDQAALVSMELETRAVADDPLEPALRERVRAAWPRVRQSLRRRRLVHGDYWPGNVLWHRGRLVGVVDWENVRLGDADRDVAICRGDLTLLLGLDAAERFLRHYEAAAGRPVAGIAFWDLLTCTLALPELEHWMPGWLGLGRRDLTLELAHERFRCLARSALARLARSGARAL